MKAYNLIAEERKMSFGTLSVIALGERGRGRYEAIIPCPLNIKNGDEVQLTESRTGKPKIKKVDGKTENNKWLARVSTEGGYIRGAYGHIEVPKDSGVEVVEEGHGAFGDAGRVGVWYDYLLVVPDKTIIKVFPSRGDAYFLAFAKDSVYEISQEEIDIFIDNNDNFKYENFKGVEDEDN